MEQYFEDYLERLTDLLNQLRQTIDGVAQEGLDWSPGEDMNSLCVLVVHTTGSGRFWIGDVPLGESSNRDRASEFVAKSLSEGALQQKIDALLAYAQKAINKFSLDDLAKICSVPSTQNVNPKPDATIQDRQVSVAWSLLHALEHTAVHVGHAQITRQLWDQRNG